MVLGEAFNHFEDYLLEWVAQVSQGQNPFADISEEKIKEMYALAYHLYRDQQYVEASHFFRLLAVCRPSDGKYWKGLGSCLQMQQEYQYALDCYICSQTLNRGDQPDPYLYVHAADCYFALNQKEDGLKALEAARLSAEENQDVRVLNHVALMRDLWSK